MSFFNAHVFRGGVLAASLIALLLNNAGAQQKSNATDAAAIVRSKSTNTPKSIRFAKTAHFTPQDANKIFSRYLPINDATDQMILRHTTNGKNGMRVDRYDQYFKGIKVERGTYTITSKDGVVGFMTGNFYKTDQKLSASPALTEEDALNKALDFTGAQKYMWQDPGMEKFIKTKMKDANATYYPKGEIVWIEDMASVRGGDGKLHLAYAFDVYAQKPLSRKIVYVDATTGKILFANPLIHHVATTGYSLYSGNVPIQTSDSSGYYILKDVTRGSGVHTYNLNNGIDYSLATDFVSASDTWPSSSADSQSIDAHWASEKVYDYWDSVQGRHSYDDADGEIDGYVHFDVGYDNAFWDGAEMNYGDGSGLADGGFLPLVSLDVCAHEIGHGVCQYTANLDYEGESGAMNEGFSDCWGASIEHWADTMPPKKMWKIGEEIGAGSPLRSMDTPKLQGQPDTYTGVNWFDVTSCTPGTMDDCGVHTNSGVLNHWYYLLCQGGAGTNDLGSTFAVSGIGIAEGENILYQTELVLANNAQYADCRTASINVATLLYGSCSAEVEAVTRAWFAVGVGPDYVVCSEELGFANATQNVAENANSTACPASHVVNIPVAVIGLAPTGGNPTVTASITGGTAVSGTDFSLPSSPSVTFLAGSLDTQYIPLTIYDNGAVGDDKDIILTLSLSADGAGSILAPGYSQTHIYIKNDDRAPGTDSSGHRINSANVTSYYTSPFFGGANRARAQYIITASELTAAGVLPGVPFLNVIFNVTEKNTTTPYTNYTVRLANTAAATLDGGFVTTGLIDEYMGDYTTTLGENVIPFSGSFTWDGTSNMAMEVCFSNASADVDNDKVDGYQSGSDNICAFNFAFTSGEGCTLPHDDTYLRPAKPVMTFTQIRQPVVDSTLSDNRSWYVRHSQEVYFYAPDSQLIAGVKGASGDLGCTEAKITASGDGFVPASFGPVNRSVKEFRIIPTGTDTSTTYTATLYFRNSELGATSPSVIKVVKTDAATDAAIDASNTQVATPTIFTGTNYTGFSGSFTGFSRYFLIDGSLSVPAISSPQAVSMSVDNNPFRDQINVSYSINEDVKASVKLFDMTGRVLYSNENTLTTGSHKLVIDCSRMDIAAGNYVLQVITPGNVFTKKMVKEQ